MRVICLISTACSVALILPTRARADAPAASDRGPLRAGDAPKCGTPAAEKSRYCIPDEPSPPASSPGAPLDQALTRPPSPAERAHSMAVGFTIGGSLLTVAGAAAFGYLATQWNQPLDCGYDVSCGVFKTVAIIVGTPLSAIAAVAGVALIAVGAWQFHREHHLVVAPSVTGHGAAMNLSLTF